MDKRFGIIPALLFSLLAPAAASADALCNYDDTVRMDTYLKKGKEAEKAGRTRAALLYYKAVDSFCGDGVQAKNLIRRMGLKLGAKAADKGRILSEEGLFRKVPDEDCRKWMRYLHIDTNPYEPAVPGHCTTESGGTRVELNADAGAFDWYEATFNYREADYSLLKLLAKRPGDLAAFELVYRHFEARKKVNSTGYVPEKSILAEVEKTALANLDSALSREDREYAASRQADGSIKTLTLARRWASYLEDGANERVSARAVARGKGAMEAATPSGLTDALAFFSFAGEGGLKTAVLQKANGLGRAALEKKDYLLAEEFFMVEGNERMVAMTKKMAAEEAAAKTAKEKP